MRPLPIHPPRVLPLPLQAIVVILACILLFWFGIASSGFNQSEGFRVFPAYEMLDSGDWVVPRLFGQAYLRKPPGVPWAIALFSELLGRTEFAARAASAYAMTLSCLATLLAAYRWFGPRFSLLAALAHALTPLFWYSARAAEIEAINNLFTQLCVFAILDALLTPRPARALSPIACLWITLGTAGLLLSKGPASLPCVAGALLACAIAQRRIATALNPYALAALALGCVPFIVWLYLATIHSKGLDPVTQTPGRFLWDPKHLAETLLLIPRAWASALPWSAVILLPLVLLLPRSQRGRCQTRLGESDGGGTSKPLPEGGVWGGFLSRTNQDNRGENQNHPPDAFAQALTLTTLLALLIYTITGINNVRYAMPALTTFFPLIAWFWSRNRSLTFLPLTVAPARAARAWQLAPILALALAACVWLPMEEARRNRNSGREIGRQLADALPSDAVLWGDLMIDTRPEVLYYASERGDQLGKRFSCLWKPDANGETADVPPGRAWVIRTDEQDEFKKEWKKFESHTLGSKWKLIFEGSIQGGKFRFKVYWIPATPPYLPARRTHDA